MNLFQWIKIEAETMIKDRKTAISRRLNPQLQLHYGNVQKIVKGIKDSGDIIQMSNNAQLIGNDDGPDKIYQTVVYHGMTRSSEKKTFITTTADGTVQSWTESVA
jgi:hypothetical protein